MKNQKISDLAVRQSALNQKLMEEGILVDGKSLLPVSLSPYLIKHEKYLKLTYLCQKIASVLEKFLRLYIENKDIQDMYPELSRYRTLTLKKPLYDNWVHLARFDIAETIDGSFRLLETNCDCPGAILFTPMINKILKEIEAYPQIVKEIKLHQPIADQEIFIQSLKKVYQKLCGSNIPNIGFLTSSFRTISSDMNLLEKIGKKMGINCKHINIQELRSTNNRICFDDHPIDVAYQKFDAFIDEDNQAKPCIFEHSPNEVEAYWKAINEEKMLVFNSFPSALVAENKRTLAYLQQPEIMKYFTAEENEVINNFIPKTYSFYKKTDKGQLADIEMFIKDKNSYVIKRAIDTRGRGVFIGSECDISLWKTLVQKTLKEPYIIQEYIHNNSSEIYSATDMPIRTNMYSNLAMFIIAGSPCGLISRASTEIVTNVGKSGCVRPVYVV